MEYTWNIHGIAFGDWWLTVSGGSGGAKSPKVSLIKRMRLVKYHLQIEISASEGQSKKLDQIMISSAGSRLAAVQIDASSLLIRPR